MAAPPRAALQTPELSDDSLPPIFFSPEGSPLQRTYRALLREASRRDALDERLEQQQQWAVKQSSKKKSAAAGATGAAGAAGAAPIINAASSSAAAAAAAAASAGGALEGQHVQMDRFTDDLLERAGISTAEQDELRHLSSASSSSMGMGYSRQSSSGGSSLPTISARGGLRPSMSPEFYDADAPSMLLPPSSGGYPSRVQSRGGNGGGGGGGIMSEEKLVQNRNLVDVLNDVQQVTLCFQEIIKHISFHRVNTGRVLWKLQATYVQLFEKMVKVFSQREKKKQEAAAEVGGEANQEIDLLRLQVMDGQAKLDAAEKTKFQFKDTIKEQAAQINVLNAEVDTLRAALVEEATAADAAVQRREEEEKEIRHKVQLDVKQRSDARRALFGGNEPSELDEAFTKSLGTMHDTIEDADIRVHEQETLLNDMNSLMDVQQVRRPSFCFCFCF